MYVNSCTLLYISTGNNNHDNGVSVLRDLFLMYFMTWQETMRIVKTCMGRCPWGTADAENQVSSVENRQRSKFPAYG